jgi:hypothetical protein
MRLTGRSGGAMPNNALERTVNHRGALHRCESALWPAAQLGR